jgi:chemotaxis protein CheD
MFADTGVPAFLEAAGAFGLSPGQAKVVVAGGGQMPGQSGESDIGGRNSLALEGLMTDRGWHPHHRSVGGKLNRTLKLEIASGKNRIQIPGQTMEEI